MATHCQVNILAIDAATVSGFAFGRAGEKPTSWSKRMRTSDEDLSRGYRKFGCHLRDFFQANKVDLVIVESAIPIGAMMEKDDKAARGFRFKSNPETIKFLHGLVSGIHFICGPYGIRCDEANVQKVRKHLLGHARPTDPKKAVMTRLRQIGYFDRDCDDNNRSDAIALHIYASDTIARVAPRELALFGERAPA